MSDLEIAAKAVRDAWMGDLAPHAVAWDDLTESVKQHYRFVARSVLDVVDNANGMDS